MARERPHLRLVEIADRVHRRRVVGVPGKVAHQPFRLVAGADRQGAQPRRLIEEHEHPHARHHVAAAARIGIAGGAQIAFHRIRDLDRFHVDPKRVHNALRIAERIGARGAIRHPDRVYVLRSERTRAQIGHDRRIDAAAQAQHGFADAAALDQFVAQKCDEPAFGKRRIDDERCIDAMQRCFNDRQHRSPYAEAAAHRQTKGRAARH